jgi:hypothetical protein
VGLKQNGTILAQYPVRQIGGGVSGERSMWGRSELRNQFVGEGISDKLAGMPNGHIHPSSWCMARLPGMISSYVGLDAVLVVTPLNVAGGVNASGTASPTLTVASAPLSLIAAASGTIALTLTPDATISGIIGISGSVSAALSVPSASIQATFSATGTATASLSATGTMRALGNLEGSITPYTALSPQSLSQAVWDTLAIEANKVGTMGAKVNAAGAASDPWSVTLEGTYTAADLVRIMSAVLAGSATGTNQPGVTKFRSVDGTKDRVTSTQTEGARTTTALNGA